MAVLMRRKCEDSACVPCILDINSLVYAHLLWFSAVGSTMTNCMNAMLSVKIVINELDRLYMSLHLHYVVTFQLVWKEADPLFSYHLKTAVVFYFVNKKCSYWFKAKETENSQPLLYSLNAWDWFRLEARARNSILVSHLNATTYCFVGCISARSWNLGYRLDPQPRACGELKRILTAQLAPAAVF